MAERPEHAPSADTPCEVCGEELGEYWGVSKTEWSTFGRFKSYQPIHSACWWETHPAEQKRHDEIVASTGYQLQRVKTRRELDREAKKRAEMEAKVS